jgi:hypothetical protein
MTHSEDTVRGAMKYDVMYTDVCKLPISNAEHQAQPASINLTQLVVGNEEDDQCQNEW